jgi:uncharacterized damage-inducible protein DinB
MTPETAAPSASTYTTKSAKQRFLDKYEIEHAKTRKVLAAFPADKSDLRPHERSSTALTLAWTFVVEEQLIHMALTNTLVLGRGMPKAPDSWNAVLEAFDKGYDDVVAVLRNPENAELGGTVTFYVAPKQTGDIPIGDFVDFMLCDQIHHRGQLSVYVRMAGGKVPSIYGPSADEPWF